MQATKRARKAPPTTRFPAGDALAMILSFCGTADLHYTMFSVCREWRRKILEDANAWPAHLTDISSVFPTLARAPASLPSCRSLDVDLDWGDHSSIRHSLFPNARHVTIDTSVIGLKAGALEIVRDVLSRCPAVSSITHYHATGNWVGHDVTCLFLGLASLRTLRTGEPRWTSSPRYPQAPQIEALKARLSHGSTIKLIGACPNLRRLRLTSSFSSPSIADLRLERLELLEVDGYNVGTLALLSRLPSLKHLSIECEQYVDEALWTHCKGLKTLRLPAAFVYLDFKRMFGAFEALESLSIDPPDEGWAMELVKHLPPTLRHLCINKQIADSAIVVTLLRRCPLLEAVKIYTTLDDAFYEAATASGHNLVVVDAWSANRGPKMEAMIKACPKLRMIRTVASCNGKGVLPGFSPHYFNGCHVLCREDTPVAADGSLFLPFHYPLFESFERSIRKGTAQ